MRPGKSMKWLVVGAWMVCTTLGCREGEEADNSVPVPPSVAGAHGCQGLAGVLSTPAGASLTVMGLPVGPASRMAANLETGAAGRLYITGVDAAVYELELDTLGIVSGNVLVAPGTIAALPAYAGLAAPVLSGIAVLPGFLVLAEHTGNTLLLADRAVSDNVFVAPGLLADDSGGNADGTAGQVRFHFEEPIHLVSSAGADIYLTDSGNHSIRLVRLDGLASSSTLVGSGAPGFQDGGLASGQLDTPTALSISCAGALVVSELGSSAVGGQRVRSLSLGFDGFGNLEGTLSTLAGDGTAASVEGTGVAASLAAPDGVVSTHDAGGDEIFLWIDSTTGILRRLDPSTGLVDCPLDPGCVSAGLFTPGGSFSLAVLEGVLYVLDTAAGMLFRVTS